MFRENHGHTLAHLPQVVLGMERSVYFTHAEVCQRLGIQIDLGKNNEYEKVCLENIMGEIGVDLYLNRLTEVGILNRKGYRYWWGLDPNS